MNSSKVLKGVIAGVAGVAVLCAAAFILVTFVFARDFSQLVKSEDNYGKELIQKELKTSSHNAIDALSEALTQENIGKTKGVMGLSLDADDEYIKELSATVGAPEEFGEIFRLLAASELDLTVKSDTDNMSFSLESGLKVKGEQILSSTVAYVNNKLFLKAPQLYSKVLALDLAEYAGALQTINTGELKDLSDSIAKAKPMADEIIDALVQNINCLVDDNDEVTVGGSTVKLDVVTIYLTSQQQCDISKAIANVILGNDEYLSIITEIGVKFADAFGLSQMGLDTSNTDSIKGELKEGLSDFIKSASPSDFNDIILKLYVNNFNRIVGLDASGSGDNFGFIYLPGKGYEFWVLSDGNEIRINGTLKSDKNGLSGDVNMINNVSGEKIYNGKLGELHNLKVSKDGKDASGEFVMKFSDIMNGLVKGSYDGMTDAQKQLVNRIEMRYSFEMTEKSSTVGIDIVDAEKQAKLSIKAEEVIDGSLSIPDMNGENLQTVDDVNSLLSNIDMEEVLANLQKIAEKIESLGFNLSALGM